MTSQQDVVAALEETAPACLAEPWDNVGWQVRCETSPITGLLCAVDVTEAVLDEAAARGANLIIAHHPPLFHPLRSLDAESRVGSVLTRAVQMNISIIAAHTNWDSAPGGISWALTRHLGLDPIEPLISSDVREEAGLGIIARSPTPLTSERLANWARHELGSSVISMVGEADGHERVALMGGSGTSGILRAAEIGATLYITADVRYHDAQEAEGLGLSLLVIDHGASERPGMAELGRILASRLGTPANVSQTPTSPWR
jgi:dinuclear metal center YbgI/SA1388 family protein